MDGNTNSYHRLVVKSSSNQSLQLYLVMWVLSNSPNRSARSSTVFSQGFGGMVVLRSIGLRKNIENGQITWIWEEKWIPSLPGFSISTPKTDNLEVVRVCDLMDASNKAWDRMNVLESPWSSHPQSSSSSNQNLCKYIWNSKAPPMIRNFLRRAATNSLLMGTQQLPVQHNLFKRKAASSPQCQICGQDEETVEQMLFFCSHALETWFLCPLASLHLQHGGVVYMILLAIKWKTTSYLLLFSPAAYVLREACYFAIRIGGVKVSFETDSKVVTDAIKMVDMPIRWDLDSIISDIQRVLASFEAATIDYINMKANTAADWLEQSCFSSACSNLWLSVPPKELGEILYSDAL
ncbi:hypothetical protein RCOM_0006440 [Ricinus communis]|uniref:RNase H type-1 domain-containing protein n=1 Tax=Ricinus communis TaxID=3988 RepID=B9SZQ3_RICCO|nr:hypothetical protein RCOM_0006440 [Ricinus communis]